jgi:predicted DNA-binding protein (MmcQ/YjbR family)
MNLSFIQDYCLAKKGAEETFPFGPDTLVYKVMGKAFLLTGINGFVERINVKCDPEKAIELRELYESIQPGYHMNKKHWNTIIIDGSLTLTIIKQCIDDSYDLIVKALNKKDREILENFY